MIVIYMKNSSTHIFDKTKFMKNFHGLETIAWELIATFLTTLPALKKKIEFAILSKDSLELELTAHTLKGVISNFHAEPAQKITKRLEEMGHNKITENNEEIFKELNLELDRLAIELQEYLKNKG